MNKIIDFNADVGEGLNNEALLLPYLDSCSIACGGHAGSLETIREVVTLANHHNVKVGAHPSFPDQANFGRVEMDMSSADLFTSIKEQLRAFLMVLRESRTMINHIKPHGALYNMAVYDERIASVVVEAIKGISTPVKLFAPFNSVISKIATDAGISVKFEGFADRNYNEDLSLVSRKLENSVIENEVEIFEHVDRMFNQGIVKTIGGKMVEIEVDTFCVHGDNKNALNILKSLSKSYR
ncbi:UPF0271 protein [Flavobacteriaceae bacterium MAR_2010_188]|nr:UPF0271 protein [Flavobacteriaceae bacterium MAR_2010_188]